MTIIVTLMWKILCVWHLHYNMPKGEITWLKSRFPCSGMYSYSRKCWALANAYSMENKCKIHFFPLHHSVRHLLMYDNRSPKQSKIIHVLWWFDVFLISCNRLKISMWPLTSKCHTQSFIFSVYHLCLLHPLHRKVHLFFLSCSIWRVFDA